MAQQNFSILTPAKAIPFVYQLLRSPHTQHLRILLHGEPGVGKSAVMRMVARLLGATMIDLRLLQLDLGALRGLERIVTDPVTGICETVPTRPYFLPEYVADEDITDDTPRYVIFLDEIMAADDAIRKCAFELLTDSRIGPHRIGRNVYVVAAGNSAEDGTIVYEMDRATRDRFLHAGIESDLDGLIEHAIAGKWHYHVVSFMKNNPGIITASDEDLQNDNLAAPSPRSHEEISNILYAYDAKHIDVDVRNAAVRGMIGNFGGDLLIESIEDEESQFDLSKLVTAKPNERVYPQNPFGSLSLAGALAAYSSDKDKLDVAIDVMMAMPDDTNDCVEECKTAFVQHIGPRLKEWRLYAKYATDDRILRFLAATADITKEKDDEYAASQQNQQKLAA